MSRRPLPHRLLRAEQEREHEQAGRGVLEWSGVVREAHSSKREVNWSPITTMNSLFTNHLSPKFSPTHLETAPDSAFPPTPSIATRCGAPAKQCALCALHRCGRGQ